MERDAQPKLDRAEQLVGWITGDYLSDFAYLTATSEDYYLRLVPPHSRRRMLLGPGNIGEDLGRNLNSINEAADEDEHFAFALSLYRDALHEANQLFKIARLFSVLEALAYALKAGGVGSRRAIRTMLDLEAGAVGETSYGGRTIRFERIELSGRLRDKLFHGVQFRREELNDEWRDSYDLLTDKPEILVDALMSDCELQFARWGNNNSIAREAAQRRGSSPGQTCTAPPPPVGRFNRASRSPRPCQSLVKRPRLSHGHGCQVPRPCIYLGPEGRGITRVGLGSRVGSAM